MFNVKYNNSNISSEAFVLHKDAKFYLWTKIQPNAILLNLCDQDLKTQVHEATCTLLE